MMQGVCAVHELQHRSVQRPVEEAVESQSRRVAESHADVAAARPDDEHTGRSR